MRWSLYLGKVSGIKIFVHWTFVFLLVWVTFGSLRMGLDLRALLITLGFVFAVFFCITLHELGHMLVAQKFKYKTRDITLLPIGGMARMDEFPENPRHELLVAIAGPAVNIAIALVLYPVVFWLGRVPSLFILQVNEGSVFLFNLLVVNLLLAVFNLIPAFPMDGGRIFRALLAMRMNRVKATDIAARTGQVISVLFVIAGFFYNPFLIIIGIFIFMMAQTETDYVRSKSFLHNFHVRDVVIRKYYSLDATATVEDAVRGLLEVQASDFLVMENNEVVGTLDRNRIIKALAEKGKSITVQEVMNSKVEFVTPDMPLDQLFTSWARNGTSLHPVVDHGRLIGVVDRSNILEFILIKNAEQGAGRVTPRDQQELESAA